MNREEIGRLVDQGAKYFIYKGQTVTIIDDKKGWTYCWDGGADTRNLDETLDAIEAASGE